VTNVIFRAGCDEVPVQSFVHSNDWLLVGIGVKDKTKNQNCDRG
jgi:hypothetical protein